MDRSASSPLYNRVYFHAVRRAMLENETVLKTFMDNTASKYSDDKLELLDELLVAITDNDLFDLLMARKLPAGYDDKFTPLYEEIYASAETMSQAMKSAK